MDTTLLTGHRVKHKSFGSGKITSVNGDKLRVTFETGDTKVFKFPQAFTAYLEIDDTSLMQEILVEESKRKVKENVLWKEEAEMRQLRARQEDETRRRPISTESAGRNWGTYEFTAGNREEAKTYKDGIIGPTTVFATHAGALNACFGYHYKNYQKAYKNLGNGYAVWFPNIARKAGNQYLSSDEYWGWLNVLSDSGDTLTEFDNPDFTGSSGPDKNRRIIFARFKNDRGYRFIGIYAYPKRVENGDEYTRIATVFDTKRMKVIDMDGNT